MKKVLVANRGEIAVRIIKTLKKMGIISVAIYSEADKNALHVQMADQAVFVGPSPSNQSYLNSEKIIQEALKLNVDGIHPGYGFLSENATFAQKVNNAGITFIGPSVEAIQVMGSKLAAKDAVKNFKIPMVPGIDHAITDIKNAQIIADQIGYPVLIKASAGGGGKGMRISENSIDFKEQIERAVSEAEAAFGDGSVFIEKNIPSPRHIEIQVLADNFGNTVHLFERECSIQRRHQKVIEEAPSSILTPEIRDKMGTAAVKVAQACNYTGAGTVEFLLDENLNFYFLEMNTRLQVEHPVTEEITGIDLVEQQIKIARNEPLKFTQDSIRFCGHALEIRVYAEDPFHDFLPSVGQLTNYIKPIGTHVRVDDAFEKGMEIPIYYDPMIAKLIVWGKDRNEAIARMKEAIATYRIEGIATTLPFCEFVMDHPAFVSGNFDTQFVKKHFTTDIQHQYSKQKAHQAAVIALAHWKAQNSTLKVNSNTSLAWQKR